MAFTYFFRDIEALELTIEHLLPTVQGSRYIRIWDAGCAHGPEAFSLAILLREKMSRFLFRNVHIHATDIDTCDQFGRIVNEGVYPEGEVKRIPSTLREKYFAEGRESGHYRINDEIKSGVEFMQHDLLSLEPVRTGFALIVCKNVLLHFNPAQRVNVMKMFHDALRDGGLLVTENTQKLPQGAGSLFEQVTRKAQVFRKAS